MFRGGSLCFDVYPIKLRSICYCPILNIYIKKAYAYTRTLLSIFPFFIVSVLQGEKTEYKILRNYDIPVKYY